MIKYNIPEMPLQKAKEYIFTFERSVGRVMRSINTFFKLIKEPKVIWLKVLLNPDFAQYLKTVRHN
jgi:hypothetical protein